MAYEWQNSGPAALDLTTPLMEGQKAGTMEAYRQDQIKAQAAKEADMRARLGLDQQAQEFQKNVFAAGAGLRAAQLSEANARATMLSNTADQTISGAPELADNMHALNLAHTPEDIEALPTTLENATEPQQQQYQQALNAKKTTLAYQIHAKTATDQALNEAQAVQEYAHNGGQVSQFDGKTVPTDPTFMINGQPDLGKIGDFNRAAALKAAQAKEDMTVKGQQTVAETQGEQRAKTMEIAVGGKEANANAADLSRQVIAAHNNLIKLQTALVPDATAIKQAQSEYNMAKAAFDNRNSPQGATSTAPTTSPQSTGNAGTDFLRNVFGGQ